MWIEVKNKDSVINLESGITIHIDGNMIVMEKNGEQTELGTYSNVDEANERFSAFKSSLFKQLGFFHF